MSTTRFEELRPGAKFTIVEEVVGDDVYLRDHLIYLKLDPTYNYPSWVPGIKTLVLTSHAVDEKGIIYCIKKNTLVIGIE
jgi:hypothetical protein